MNRLGKRFVIIGSVDDQRITRFQAALDRMKLPSAKVVDYPDLIAGHVSLGEMLEPGDILRIESPGKSSKSEQLLLELGRDQVEPHFERSKPIQHPEGFIYSSRQWYLGFCSVLEQIEGQRATAPPHSIMNGISAIRTMFDKRATQETLQAADIPIPPFLPPVHNYDELRHQMDKRGIRRVFIKLAHGSSASGAIAYETNGRQEKASTTIEYDDQWRLFNSLKVCTIHKHATIRRLIDAICRHRVHVEQWIPKGSLNGQRFDVRVLAIGGQAQHSVLRLSNSPFTNLHLGNNREPIEVLLDKIGVEPWQEVENTCERAAACFPDAFYTGIDLLFTPDLRRHFVLELNAFGDLLLRVYRNCMDPYEMQIRQFVQHELLRVD
ncbi:MAG: STM4014 family protein [Chloroflexota bacterium]